MTRNQKLKQLECFAAQTFTPILREDSRSALCRSLKESNPSRILEIGTAIGYSAILILDLLPFARLVSLEIRVCRYEQAKRNLLEAGVSERAELLLTDAETYLRTKPDPFDYVFLDGPKGQYARLLPRIASVLRPGGTIFADNLNYDGRVAAAARDGVASIPRKHRAAVRGLLEYRRAVSEPPFRTEFSEAGDGIGITVYAKD